MIAEDRKHFFSLSKHVTGLCKSLHSWGRVYLLRPYLSRNTLNHAHAFFDLCCPHEYANTTSSGCIKVLPKRSGDKSMFDQAMFQPSHQKHLQKTLVYRCRVGWVAWQTFELYKDNEIGGNSSETLTYY